MKMKWRFSIDPRSAVGYVRIDRKVGCSFVSEEICVIYGDEDRENRGHLIAAAPDLYEALKGMLTLRIDYPESPRVLEARAALAKAEGR